MNSSNNLFFIKRVYMLHECLRLFRIFHDKKLIELAQELGISPSYLSEIESGKKQPSMEIIQKYSKIFKTTSSSILFFSEELDRSKKRGKIKISIRNKLIKFMQVVENGKNKNL